MIGRFVVFASPLALVQLLPRVKIPHVPPTFVTRLAGSISRIFGIASGKSESSQQMPLFAVKVFTLCLFKPWIATMLRRRD